MSGNYYTIEETIESEDGMVRMEQLRCSPTFGAFRRARWKATLEILLTRLRGNASTLLSYYEVQQRIPVETELVRLPGEHPVPLDAIVGSVGRYVDFTPSFWPRHDGLEARWVSVGCHLIEPSTGVLPPVSLYKLDDAYFVVDGNHRVSVARAKGDAFIWAHVTEVRRKVPVQSSVASLAITQPCER